MKKPFCLGSGAIQSIAAFAPPLQILASYPLPFRSLGATALNNVAGPFVILFYFLGGGDGPQHPPAIEWQWSKLDLITFGYYIYFIDHIDILPSFRLRHQGTWGSLAVFHPIVLRGEGIAHCFAWHLQAELEKHPSQKLESCWAK